MRRCFLCSYRQVLVVLTPAHFFPSDRALRPEGLNHSPGVAPSGFPPLHNIPPACLPWESGRYLSPSVADHPLRPATNRSLGDPLPHQLANLPRAPPPATEIFYRISEETSSYAVLASLSAGYSTPRDKLPTCYSPGCHFTQGRTPFHVRLACVKHDASVRSEP